MASLATGSFWLCPSCSKHGPRGQTSCKCGSDRAGEKAAAPVIDTRTSDTSPQSQGVPDRKTAPASTPGEHPTRHDIRQQEEAKRLEEGTQRRGEEPNDPPKERIQRPRQRTPRPLVPVTAVATLRA